MPNIKGTFGCLWIDGAAFDGGFTYTTHGNYRPNAGSNGVKAKLYFNASSSSSVYKDNGKIQPNSRKCKYFIRFRK